MNMERFTTQEFLAKMKRNKKNGKNSKRKMDALHAIGYYVLKLIFFISAHSMYIYK